MGTGRKFHKKPATRPKKNGTEKMRREETHKKRLMELGMDEEAIKHLTIKDIRTLLQRPLQTKAKLEAAKQK